MNTTTYPPNGLAATPEALARLELIAQHQTVSPVAAPLPTDTPPSIELVQELIWDATETLDLTDEEVRDYGVWASIAMLGHSYGKVAASWGIPKPSAQTIVKRMEKKADNDKEGTHLAIASGVCLLAATHQNRMRVSVEN